MDTIEKCHALLGQLLGATAEPIEVLRRTEEHRQYWKPRQVKVILLAESHVYTTADELTRKVCLPAHAPSDIPSGFVRLVYCLGYGENKLLDKPILTPANAGTPQFWKIFYSCVNPVRSNADFASIQSSIPIAERISNKLATLERLRDLGVWLVDTSLAALYRPGQEKSSRKTLTACLCASWDAHVRSLVTAAAPSRIICIGKGVRSALGDLLYTVKIPVTVVAQPNARLTSADHQQVYETYYRLVREANDLP